SGAAAGDFDPEKRFAASLRLTDLRQAFIEPIAPTPRELGDQRGELEVQILTDARRPVRVRLHIQLAGILDRRKRGSGLGRRRGHLRRASMTRPSRDGLGLRLGVFRALHSSSLPTLVIHARTPSERGEHVSGWLSYATVRRSTPRSGWRRRRACVP